MADYRGKNNPKAQRQGSAKIRVLQEHPGVSRRDLRTRDQRKRVEGDLDARNRHSSSFTKPPLGGRKAVRRARSKVARLARRRNRG